MKLTSIALLASAALLAAEPRTPTFVWWEAEEPATQTHASIEKHKPDSADGAVLSGHGLLRPDDKAVEKMTALYKVTVPAKGEYHLWGRKFWKHGPFKWRINNGEWSEIGKDIALHSSTTIRLHQGTNWVHMGKVKLPAGEQTFEIESIDNKGFFDCFLLIDGLFQPAGRLKPGEKSGAADEGYFAWEPDGDRFTDESAIDLRFLNEKFAGASGFIRREGDKFLLGDGTPVRFWMTQFGSITEMDPYMQEVHARRLAKYGVNMARLFFLDLFQTWRSGDKEKFKYQLDQVHHAVAALKKEGIYTYFGHLFWDTHVTALSDNDMPGLKKGERPIAALFVNEPLQKYFLKFVSELMLPVNPYTGHSLAEDPAVAIVEVQNESNALFWTSDPKRLAPDTLERMQKQFAGFAAKKHGSLEAAFAHWGDKLEGDAPDAGKSQILSPYNLTTKGYAAHPRRAADQIQFLTELQYQTYAGMKKSFSEMRLRNMITGSNWKTADPSTLGPLEHHSYTATDMINRNEYFSPGKGENPRFHAVDTGDVFKPVTAMRNPQTAAPLMTNQIKDWPYMITENNWDNPNPYRAEWPFLVATYGAMAGIDGWNFFAYDNAMWVTDMGVWNTNSPVILGQYPAYALMYRRGDVKEGPSAVVEHRRLESLYQNEPIALPEVQYKDLVWQKELGGDPTVDFNSKIDPRAFFVGPVRLDLSAEKHELKTVKLEDYIDNAKGEIRNTNGQLLWNFGKGYATVDTPTSQGVAGFLGKAGKIRLSNVIIESNNEYATVVVVAMDSLPITESKRILIQTATQDKPFGYKTVDAGDGALKITAKGGYPLNVKKISTKVTLTGLAGRTVTALDALGYPTKNPVTTETTGNNLVITLPEDTLYTLVK